MIEAAVMPKPGSMMMMVQIMVSVLASRGGVSWVVMRCDFWDWWWVGETYRECRQR